VSSGAQAAAGGIANVARKARVPLLAGGAAIAGAASAVALTRRDNRRKLLGVSMPKGGDLLPRGGDFKKNTRRAADAVTGAAKRADELGQRMSRVAGTVRQVSETASEATKES